MNFDVSVSGKHFAFETIDELCYFWLALSCKEIDVTHKGNTQNIYKFLKGRQFGERNEKYFVFMYHLGTEIIAPNIACATAYCAGVYSFHPNTKKKAYAFPMMPSVVVKYPVWVKDADGSLFVFDEDTKSLIDMPIESQRIVLGELEEFECGII